MSQLEVRTLLVVEDEPLMLEALTDILTPLGIEVVQAENADEAMKVIASKQVTAILSDIRMPGFSGLEFLENLRATGNNIPIVFLSASSERANLHRAMQLGAIDFIEKPFEAEHLKEVVFKLLEIGVRHHEIQQLQSSSPANATPAPTENSGKTETITKKNKIINLLRIKLPWQKSS